MRPLAAALACILWLGAAPASGSEKAPSSGLGKTQQAAEFLQALELYRRGMEALSLEQLDLVMDPDLLVLEHGGKDVGWPAYRDGHIGEHMKEWKSLRVSDIKVLESGANGDWAYAAQESVNTIVTKDGKTIVLAVTETFVLKKRPGGWKIRHLHVSLKKNT